MSRAWRFTLVYDMISEDSGRLYWVRSRCHRVRAVSPACITLPVIADSWDYHTSSYMLQYALAETGSHQSTGLRSSTNAKKRFKDQQTLRVLAPVCHSRAKHRREESYYTVCICCNNTCHADIVTGGFDGTIARRTANPAQSRAAFRRRSTASWSAAVSGA